MKTRKTFEILSVITDMTELPFFRKITLQHLFVDFLVDNKDFGRTEMLRVKVTGFKVDEKRWSFEGVVPERENRKVHGIFSPGNDGEKWIRFKQTQ